jgi:type IV secretory pathway VirB4 component
MRTTNKKRNVTPTLFGADAIKIGPKTVQVGDHWCASFAVVGYPREVRPGWLDSLLSHPGAVDVSVHLEPIPPVVAAERLRKQLAKLESSRRIDASKSRLADPGLEVAALDARVLADRLARGESKLFRVGLYVTARADSEAELLRIRADVRATVASLLIDMRPTTYRSLQGWSTTLPLGIDSINMTRSFDTAAIGATYPFVASELSVPNGVLYGKNAKGTGLVFWDRFAQDNHNATILARSGAGKSYLAKLEVLRSLYRGIDVLVVDPEDEYRKLADDVDGSYIALGQSNTMLNPFDLGAEPDALSRRAMFIQSFIEVLLGTEIDPATRAVLDTAVIDAYTDTGITSDSRTHRRPPPTLADLLAKLDGNSDKAIKRLADQLRPFVTGSYRGIFDGQTTTRPEGHLVVFSLRYVPDELKAAATMLTLDHIWNTVSGPGEPKRRMVTVDEAWLLMKDPVGAKFLFRLAKAARKHWCGLTVVTQDAADLLSSVLGQAVVANSATQILMRQSTQSIERLIEAFGLSEGERAFLLDARPGDAILAVGAQRVAFRAIASPSEHELVSTSPGGDAS